ncbi:hypothetical protein RA28_19675 [Ruegeria sp. ANG-S4]|uniref:restriction endonuclease subunit S n=1 Tax=Ruegeria sp. ANG-S4 TaxID=1577904 RepID=UPI0005806BC6|nr:restriction endonuclease subunit S [Ruegeria sp. ANG-S4]KIC43847.1 hypothetical protein RA28_19675 [Ruegeria sp. ANG-S4]
MVPKGWTTKALGRSINLQGGFAFKSSEFGELGIPIVRISNIQGEIVELDGAPCYEEDIKLERFLLEDGDILIAMSGATTGKTGRFFASNSTPNAYLNQRVGRFQIKDENLLCSDFVWHLISTERFQYLVSIEAIGGAQPNVSGAEIESLTFNFPPITEQRKIAEILSTWDRAVEVAEAQLEAARTSKRALMQQLLTGKRRFPEFEAEEWKEVRLGDVCAPKQWPTIGKNDMTDSGYPVFGANGFIGFYSEFNHEHPTTVVTCRGATCGTVSRTPPSTYITGNAMSLDDVDATRVDDEFLFFALQKRGFDDIISGSAQPQIIGKDIRSVKLKLPMLTEQRKIAETLSICDSDVVNIENQITKLRTEKKALMQQLLTGKRRVVVEGCHEV